MRKYKDFILRISKLLLINLFFGIGINFIIRYTSFSKIVNLYLVILAIILPFVFKAIIMVRKNSLFVEYMDIFDVDYKAFNKALMVILIVEYIVGMNFVHILNKVLELYNPGYKVWKYEEIWFFTISMFIAILLCGSMKNKISQEDLSDYDDPYEYIENNKLIIIKKTKRIVCNAIIAAVVLGVTYVKIIDSRLDFIFDRISGTSTDEEVLEYFEKKYNIKFEIEKKTYDKKKHEYTYMLKTEDNRTFKVKQIPEEDNRILYSFHYDLEYDLYYLYEKEFQQIQYDVDKILETEDIHKMRYSWGIDEEKNVFKIYISALAYDDAKKLVEDMMEVYAYCRENVELFCMCKDVYIDVGGVNLSDFEFRVDKGELIYMYDKYSKEENEAVETELVIKDNKQLEELIKFKNYRCLVKHSFDFMKVFYSDNEKKMFQINEEKYIELYGE